MGVVGAVVDVDVGAVLVAAVVVSDLTVVAEGSADVSAPVPVPHPPMSTARTNIGMEWRVTLTRYPALIADNPLAVQPDGGAVDTWEFRVD